MKTFTATPFPSKIYIPTPMQCDICGYEFSRAVGTLMYDARTKQGSWGILCAPCFKLDGIGLGVGKGQLYKRLKKGGSFHRV